MDRVSITSSLDFSRIVYGLWRLGDDENTAPDHVRNKIAACLDQGITTMDQADIYGGYMAEEILGNALRGSDLRNKIEIVTKCDIVAPIGRYSDAPVKYYDTSAAHITQSVDTSLREMGIDQIDLLLIHRPDPLMDHHETGACLDGLIKAGKIRAAGVSNFRHWDWELLQSAMSAKLVSNQIELSLSHIAPLTNGDLSFHQRHAQPVMAWSPLGGGALMTTREGLLAKRLDAIAAEQGVDRAAVAVAFLLAHPSTILPVLGTNALPRIATISDAMRVRLDRRDWFSLYEAALGHEVA